MERKGGFVDLGRRWNMRSPSPVCNRFQEKGHVDK